MEVPKRFNPERFRQIVETVESLLPTEWPGQMAMMIMHDTRERLGDNDIDIYDIEAAYLELKDKGKVYSIKGALLPATRIYKPSNPSPNTL
ncbi:hypothetical protein KY308_02675 [Candidatus Woesearchaeota archaeon]|nr:hypothetical protein [Candidatus Woesearchaeota archaeon]